ncbi:hypothetical protein D3C76_1246850 [compost metagenome]
MAHVDFHGIESRLACQACALREVAHHLLHVGFVHRLLEEHATHQAYLVETAAGRQRTLGRALADKGKATAMGDLRAGQATGLVHTLGQGLEVRQAGLGQGQLVGQGTTIAAHRAVGHGSQGDAASGQGRVQLDQLLGRHALGTHALVGGGLDKAVLQGQWANGDRAER